jgi:anti-sigma-K factor RskA
MNCTEAQKHLSDYVDGELTHDQRQDLEQHLNECSDCQRELSKLRSLLAKAALLPASIAPDHDLWNGAAQRLAEQKIIPSEIHLDLSERKNGAGHSPPRRSLWQHAWVKGISAAAAVLVVGLGGFLLTRQSSRPAWQVARMQGTPEVGSERLTDAGHLRVGEMLETDATSRARINVGVIGNVEVEPNSRLRLLQAKTTDHRLVLYRGTIHAKIWAPPRLFFVETPSATAIDLGCEYTLSVDDRGASILRVITGWVAMEFGGHESVVPAGAMCVTLSGFGPGTPFQEDASPSLRAALQKFDFEHGGSESLTTVLSETRGVDYITLWHLLMRVGAEDRPRVYDRLTALVPPPEYVTREGVLQGNPEMLEAWQKHLNLGMKKWWQFWR